MTQHIERRFAPCGTGPAGRIEIRADGDNQIISGYAAVFHDPADAGTEFELWSDVRERIAPGAFTRALTEKQDVRALFNHSSDYVLGRSQAGTLSLSVDGKGLRYEIQIPDTTIGQDTAKSIERGDITGSSFAFFAKRVEWTMEGDIEIRTLLDVDLVDVGPVTYPAYTATTTGVRSADREWLEAERSRLLPPRTGRTAIDNRMRMIDITHRQAKAVEAK